MPPVTEDDRHPQWVHFRDFAFALLGLSRRVDTIRRAAYTQANRIRPRFAAEDNAMVENVRREGIKIAA
jgi:hypothetical protein